MNCEGIRTSAGYRCTTIDDDILFVEAPFCLAFDGMKIGAYIEEIGNGRVRISDDSNLLWTAMTNGVEASAKLASRLEEIAGRYGFGISADGEIYTSCESNHVGFYLARFVEASSEIGFFCETKKPVISSEFEALIGRELSVRYQKRIKRNVNVMGASGHQLTFPFVLDGSGPKVVYIQTIASPDGQPSWRGVYHTLGKMTDLSNIGDEGRRLVIVERGDNNEMQKVASALGTAADVLIYDHSEQLAQLAAA